MRLHLLHPVHSTKSTVSNQDTESNTLTNLKYGTVLVVGVPAIVFGVRYVIETLFFVLWR